MSGHAEGGIDLRAGVALADIPDGGMLAGEADGEAVLLVRRGDEVSALGGTCTHYGGPLRDGLLVGETVRCPWHHACFAIRTGQPVRPPALDALPRWKVELRDGRVFVGGKMPPEKAAPPRPKVIPDSVVIVGGGAAGNAAAETLRREGFDGPVTVVSADADLPCDRPNLSKGFLSGAMPEESNILRSLEFYRERSIGILPRTTVAAVDTAQKSLRLSDGTTLRYGALLLATGADPIRLPVPGGDGANVFYLRTVADSKRIVAAASRSRTVVVIGASFIGMEVAASLRVRGVDVHVVAPESIPMERVMGKDIGAFVRKLHESRGVVFHLGTSVVELTATAVKLQNGEELDYDFAVVGIGVRPATSLAEEAGISVDKGVLVNEFLETSAPGVYAAGDIARWPDALTGERIRVEHWIVAERQGETAARNILGARQPFNAVPFFWTDQYDLSIAYVGHAEHWDKAEFSGELGIDARDCRVTYSSGGKTMAVATVYRDHDSLEAELEFERKYQEGRE